MISKVYGLGFRVNSCQNSLEFGFALVKFLETRSSSFHFLFHCPNMSPIIPLQPLYLIPITPVIPI